MQSVTSPYESVLDSQQAGTLELEELAIDPHRGGLSAVPNDSLDP